MISSTAGISQGGCCRCAGSPPPLLTPWLVNQVWPSMVAVGERGDPSATRHRGPPSCPFFCVMLVLLSLSQLCCQHGARSISGEILSTCWIFGDPLAGFWGERSGDVPSLGAAKVPSLSSGGENHVVAYTHVESHRLPSHSIPPADELEGWSAHWLADELADAQICFVPHCTKL